MGYKNKDCEVISQPNFIKFCIYGKLRTKPNYILQTFQVHIFYKLLICSTFNQFLYNFISWYYMHLERGIVFFIRLFLFWIHKLTLTWSLKFLVIAGLLETCMQAIYKFCYHHCSLQFKLINAYFMVSITVAQLTKTPLVSMVLSPANLTQDLFYILHTPS